MTEATWPASYPQRRLWFLNRLVPESTAYHLCYALRLRGAVDVGAMERALDRLRARHEVLRTVFAEREDLPVQIVRPAEPTVLDLVDLTGDPAGDREAGATALLRAETQRPSDLTAGPLFHPLLIRLDPTDHVLGIIVHHIVFDGWSLGVLHRELDSLYAAAVTGGGDPPPVPVQYGEYAASQQRHLDGPAMEAGLAYWRRQLDGAPALLPLHTDRPRPAVQTFSGGIHRRTMTAESWRRVVDFARARRVTPYMTLLAAYAVLLSRLSRSTDIVVGSPVAGRTRPEHEALIGYFANTVPLRVRVRGDGSFADLLRQIRKTALDAYAHQHVPFEKLVEELRPQRTLSHNPLVQVMLTLQNAPLDKAGFTGLDVSRFVTDPLSTFTDLWMEIWVKEGVPQLNLLYSTDILDGDSVGRIADQFVHLLEHALAEPDVPLWQLSAITVEERRRLTDVVGDGGPAYPPDRRFIDLFAEQVDATPDAVAVSYRDHDVTYRELDRYADRVAADLIANGVGPEHVVGLVVSRSVELAVAVVGILKAGGAFLPLDPKAPPARLAALLSDAAVGHVVTTAAEAAGLPDLGLAVTISTAEGVVMEPAVAVKPDLHPDNLVYVIYTSGSTGGPKPVALTDRGLVNRLRWMRDHLAVTPADRILHKTPNTFDVSVWELLLPLMTGARMVVAEPDGHRDPAYLVDLIERRGVSIVHFVPPMLSAFLDQQDLQRCRSLRHVVSSGQALPAEVADRFHRRLDARLHNYYGPTEASIDVTAWTSDPRRRGGDVPIGRPIAGTRTLILDPYLQPAPTGTPGELHLTGTPLARGYLSHPDLTADRFIPHPHQPGARLYRTGDLTHHNPDHTISYLHRTDHQLKINGHRIEPAEIEDALRAHPGVRDAAVRPYAGDGGDLELVGYLVPDSGRTDPAAATRLTEETVGQWQEVFEAAYRLESGQSRPLTNFASWVSSYTGLPLPVDDMVERVEETSRLVARERPRRVLDVGCGTGLLLFRVAPGCERYVATDVSQEGLDYIRRNLADVGVPDGVVELRRQAAHDMSGLTGEGFDVVVLDSVVQYFPSIDYLVDVLHALVRTVAAGGAVILCDVRHLGLLDVFHAATESAKAPGTMTLSTLRDRVARAVADENELAIGPEFFQRLPELIPDLADVRIELKRGRAHNELTQFRYNVVLRTAAAEPGPDPRDPVPVTLDWAGDGPGGSAIADLLERRRPPAFVIRRIPNARLAGPMATADALRSPDDVTVDVLRRRLQAAPHPAAVDPEQLAARCADSGYEVTLAWSAASVDEYDLTAWRQPHDQPHDRPPTAAEGPAAERDTAARWANSPLHNRLHAAIVPAVRQALRERVADYAIPASFVVLDRLPLSASGKVDYGALPPPGSYSSANDADFVPPRTAVEHTLAAIWADVLGADGVGVTSSFFELGGDSLRCVQVVSRAARAGIALSVRQMFRLQTIAELAAEIPDRDDADTAVPADRPITRPDKGSQAPADLPPGAADSYPLSPLQDWMLRRHLTTSLPGLYVSHSVTALEGRTIDPTAFGDAWQNLLDRHPALRTSFRWSDPAKPDQVVHGHTAVPFEFEDWRDVDPQPRQRRLDDLVTRLRTTPVDPAAPSALRVLLLRWAERDYRMVLALNYMHIDGWSYPLIMREAMGLIDEAHGGDRPHLPDRPSYRSYIDWTTRRDSAAAEAFWAGELRGFGAPTSFAAALGSPGRRPDAAPADALSVARSTTLPATLTAALRARARRHGLTLYTLVQAAWGLVLAAHTGERDVVFGNVLSGRPAEVAGADDIVGYCNLQVPARLYVDREASALDWLRETQDRQAEVREHQRHPLSRIAAVSDVPDDTPLYQTCLIYMDVPLATAGVKGWRRIDSMTQTDHLLRFVVRPDQAMQLHVVYSRDVFSDDQVARVLDDVSSVFARIAHSLTVPVSHLTGLVGGDR